MKLQEVKNASSKVQKQASQILYEIESDPIKGTSFIQFLTYVLNFATNNLFKPDGSRVRIKWYDFIFNKALRDFIFVVVKHVLKLLK